jgi:hypothetical protein
VRTLEESQKRSGRLKGEKNLFFLSGIDPQILGRQTVA